MSLENVGEARHGTDNLQRSRSGAAALLEVLSRNRVDSSRFMQPPPYPLADQMMKQGEASVW